MAGFTARSGIRRWVATAFAMTLFSTVIVPGGSAAALDPALGSGPPIVNTATDTPIDQGCNPAPGDCTLREAIAFVNASGDEFLVLNVPPDAPLDAPDALLTLVSPLPTLTAKVRITPGGGACPELRPTLTVDGSALPPGSNGLIVAIGTDNTTQRYISGMSFVNFDGDGIRVEDSRNVTVYCTNLGVDGTGAPGPNGGAGLHVTGSTNISFGSPGVDNVIAANAGDGILGEQSDRQRDRRRHRRH